MNGKTGMKEEYSLRRMLIVLLVGLVLLGMTGCAARQSREETMSYRHISQDEAQKMMADQDGYIIVDVRRQDEYDEGHIPGAVLIPNESIGSTHPEALPDLNQTILVYCRSGNRSKQAAEKLANMGYTNVFEFGGINTWTGEIVIEDEYE